MIKKGIMSVGALCLTMMAMSQNAYDAERVLGNELNGTARFVGMGGAMSALGGDISVMGTNPAGIGIFRSNDASISFGFNNTVTESRFNGTSMSEDKTRASLDQLGFVYTYKIGNTTPLRFVNFGFNYHKSKNFNRLFSAGGMLNGFSQSWQLAQELEFWGMDSEAAFDLILTPQNPYWERLNEYPALSIMGARTGLVDWNAEYEPGYQGDDAFKKIPLLGWDGYSNNFFSQEKGGISQYDFNIACNIEDRLYLGATMSVYDVNYDRFSSYTEDLNDDYGEENGGYTLDNYYSLDGSGVDLKLGVIFRPFEESPFRLGLSVHTPTWYELTESYDATLYGAVKYFENDYNEGIRKRSQTLSDYMGPDYTTFDYCMQTPWKFNVSAGTTFGGLIAIGAEYEYADYGSSKLEDLDGFELGDQPSVEAFLKGVNTFRVGMETRIAPQFSFRAGYNYTSAIFSDDAYSALSLYRTSTDFNNLKERNTVTFGLGYRGDIVYADLAYKYDMYKSDFYAFDDVDLPKTEVDNSRHQLVFTLGARF